MDTRRSTQVFSKFFRLIRRMTKIESDIFEKNSFYEMPLPLNQRDNCGSGKR